MTFQFVAAGLVLIVSPWVWIRTAPLMDFEVGARVRRLRVRRAFRAMGVWECSIAFVLITTGSWSTAPALFLMGVLLMLAAKHSWIFGS